MVGGLVPRVWVKLATGIVGMAAAIFPAQPAAAADMAFGNFDGYAYGNCFQASNYVCDFHLASTWCYEYLVFNAGAAQPCQLTAADGSPVQAVRTRGNGSPTACTTNYSRMDPAVQAPWILYSPTAGSLSFFPESFINSGSAGLGETSFSARIEWGVFTVVLDGTIVITNRACGTFTVQETFMTGHYVIGA